MCFIARAMAYSATTVLPAEVWAATNTLSPISRWYTASFWKLSSSKGYYGSVGCRNYTYLASHLGHQVVELGLSVASLDDAISTHVDQLLVDVDDVRPLLLGNGRRRLPGRWGSR
jgi:hypothetical protein